MLRLTAVLGAAVVVLAILAMACSEGAAQVPREVYVTWIPLETPTAAATITEPPETPTQDIEPTVEPSNTSTRQPSSPPGVRGFAFPIAGGCLPASDSLMPGAARQYRAGIHEGVDFYNMDNCVAIGPGAAVPAAKGGTVARADTNYHDLTQSELDAALQAAISSGGTDPEAVDTFRGRQVWIEHADGTITRYAHLSGIAPGISVGDDVGQGDVIGYVGESGTPESISNPGTEMHLHFEIRIGGSYLGAGEAPGEVRRLYQQAFSP